MILGKWIIRLVYYSFNSYIPIIRQSIDEFISNVGIKPIIMIVIHSNVAETMKLDTKINCNILFIRMYSPHYYI